MQVDDDLYASLVFDIILVCELLYVHNGDRLHDQEESIVDYRYRLRISSRRLRIGNPLPERRMEGGKMRVGSRAAYHRHA